MSINIHLNLQGAICQACCVLSLSIFHFWIQSAPPTRTSIKNMSKKICSCFLKVVSGKCRAALPPECSALCTRDINKEPCRLSLLLTRSFPNRPRIFFYVFEGNTRKTAATRLLLINQTQKNSKTS